MSNNSSIIKRTSKAVGMVLLIAVGFAVILNHYVRVAGPGDKRSIGIVVNWLGGMSRSNNFKNWEISSAFSGRSVEILLKHGSNIIESTTEMQNERAKFIQYLRRAIDAAGNIEDHYLADSHPLLPEAYRKYKESLALFLRAAETKDLQRFREATLLYNGFLDFMEKHKDEFKPIK